MGEVINITIGVLTLLTILFVVYKNFLAPSQKIETLTGECLLRHSSLNADICNIKDSVEKIQNNHLAHIQTDMNNIKDMVNELKVSLAKCEAILAERNTRV